MLVSPFIPYCLRPKAHKIHQRYQHLVPEGEWGGWTFVPSSGSDWMALSQQEQQIDRAG